MVTLALATWDIVKSGYNFSVATDRQQKVEEMEALILGVTKACALFCTFTVLYATYFLVERRDHQLILTGLTFCIHPVAVLDIIGSAAAIYGIFKVGTAFRLHRENRKPIEMLVNLAREQAKKEGYQFYYFHRKGPEGPPETMKRLVELAQEFRDQHFDSEAWARLEASINTAWEYLISGRNYLGISTLCGVGVSCVNQIPKLFWLDRKMVDFSKWLAPQII